MVFANPLALAPTVIEELGKEFFARFEACFAANKESQLTACYRLALRSTSLLLGMGRVVELATFDSFEVLTRAFLESSDLLLTFRFDDAGARERIETWFEGKDGQSWKPDHNKCEEFLRNLGRGESQLGTRWSVFSALSHPTKHATDNSVGYAELWIKRLRPPNADELHMRRVADYLMSINKLIIVGTIDLPRLIPFGVDPKRIPNADIFQKGCDEAVAPILLEHQEITLPAGSYRVGSERFATKPKPTSTNSRG